MSLLDVTNITVKKYRVICLVKINGKKTSTPELANKVLVKLPNLKLHKCKNSQGKNFSEVMACTPVPHLFEHMVIDIQSKNSSNALFGTSEWIDKDNGIAKIELSYEDDIKCLNAIKKAAEVINS